ncbi:MAG: glycoside hydrolase family 127 protein, partial [Runella sp.]
VAAETGDQGYTQALERVWEDVVMRNMYITGGIGSSTKNEGFTEDYDLPNETAYCETCASVGMVFWQQRMNLYSGQSKYIDVLERSLYNGSLAGVQLTGDLFFYVNPLASMGLHHRKPWYGVACCPSNVSRLLPSVGGYLYNVSDNTFWVNLYVSSETKVAISGRKVSFSLQTNYPWSGEVELKVNPDTTTAINFALKLRLPDWCEKYTLQINGQPMTNIQNDKGYLSVSRAWTQKDVVKLRMDMPVKIVAADPRVKANVGKRALQRGPLVYCVEEQDNRHLDFEKMVLSHQTQYMTSFEPNLLNGITVIKAQNGNDVFTMIPYYAWDNRQPGRMKVWLEWKDKKVKP